MIKGIAHSAVTVKDMDESIRFYTQALGFRQAFELRRPETDEPWIVYLGICPGQFLELFYGGEDDNPWNDRLIGFNGFRGVFRPPCQFPGFFARLMFCGGFPIYFFSPVRTLL